MGKFRTTEDAAYRLKGKYVRAGLFWGSFLRACGFWAIPMPWGKCYVLPEHRDNPIMLKHEEVHFAQMERDGRVMWSIKYLYFAATRGYFGNPYEIEAYTASGYADGTPFRPDESSGRDAS